MSRLHIGAFIATGLVTLASWATSTSLASASVFTLSTGTVLNLCWINGTQKSELTGTQSITIEKKPGSANIRFGGTIGGEVFTIECTAAKQGTLEQNTITQSAPLAAIGTLTGTLVFEGCTLTAPAALAKKCSIPSSKETTSMAGSLISVTELKLLPAAGESGPFIELEFMNKGTESCPTTFKSTAHSISGFQVLTILTPEKAETTKSGEFVVKSGLKLAGGTAEVSGALTLSFTGLGDEVAVLKTA